MSTKKGRKKKCKNSSEATKQFIQDQDMTTEEWQTEVDRVSREFREDSSSEPQKASARK
jgi:hypothetical protein